MLGERGFVMVDTAADAVEHRGGFERQRVAVGGFDDSGLAATLDPPLTTMRQPLERIAGEMVRLLIDLVEGGEPAAVTLPTSLVVRASTGPVASTRS